MRSLDGGATSPVAAPAATGADPGQETRGAARRREWIAAFLIVLCLVAGRSLVFVLFEQAQFDADQAVMGLTAKHIAQGRAFPVFQYAQNYVLVVEAWLAAPFVGLGGLSVGTLRLPLVLLNLAAGWLLVWLLVRELRLRPLMALVPAMFFIAAPPVLAAELVTALGGNIEPFVYVLVLWIVRRRPAIFGVVFLVGFLNREFTAYALGALLVVEALQGTLWDRDNLRGKAVSLGAFVAGWVAIQFLNARADVFGPGTIPGLHDLPPSNLSIAAAFLCPDPDLARVGANLWSLANRQMAILLGAAPFELAKVNIASPTRQGLPGLWPAMSIVLLAVLARVAWIVVRDARARPDRMSPPPPRGEPERAAPAARTSRYVPHPGTWFAGYLALIGVQSGVMWVLSRCDPLNFLTLRYALLAVLLPIALVAAFLALERRAVWRVVVTGFVAAWALVSVHGHANLLAHYLSDPSPSEYRLLADELLARQIRFVNADYWAAYMIAFLTDERVFATPTDYVRIAEYDIAVSTHPMSAVWLSRPPCPGGEAFRRWYLCRPGAGR